jgi:hypothetical protein
VRVKTSIPRAPYFHPADADKVMRVLLEVLSGHALADAQRHLEVLEQTDLDWTFVRQMPFVSA